MIKQFDRQVARKLAQEVVAALQPIAAKYGLKVQGAGGKFDTFELNQRIRWSAGGEKSEQIKWNENCDMFDLKPSDFGKTVLVHGEKFKIVGILPRRSKFPVVVENASGKQLVVTASVASR